MRGMKRRRTLLARTAIVWRMRSSGLSERDICRITGWSMGSVSRLAQKIPPELLAPARIGRCSTCGATVRLPCLRCRLELSRGGLWK